MMTLSLGRLLRRAREKKDLTRDQLAKRVGCSAEYVRKLENDAPVPLSAGLETKLKKILRCRIPLDIKERHNKRSDRYYRAYRQSRLNH